MHKKLSGREITCASDYKPKSSVWVTIPLKGLAGDHCIFQGNINVQLDTIKIISGSVKIDNNVVIANGCSILCHPDRIKYGMRRLEVRLEEYKTLLPDILKGVQNLLINESVVITR